MLFKVFFILFLALVAMLCSRAESYSVEGHPSIISVLFKNWSVGLEEDII